MRLAQHQQVAGLGDVLRRRTPVHPAAVLLADHARQLPDQRHDGVAGAGEALVDARAIEQLQPRGARDRLGGIGGDDAEFGLRAGQRDLDVQPGLPAVLQPVQRADAGIGNARGSREIAHGVSLLGCGHSSGGLLSRPQHGWERQYECERGWRGREPYKLALDFKRHTGNDRTRSRWRLGSIGPGAVWLRQANKMSSARVVQPWSTIYGFAVNPTHAGSAVTHSAAIARKAMPPHS